jgi:anti-sigma regulatory factor (Ser/Thr protein kinase)
MDGDGRFTLRNRLSDIPQAMQRVEAFADRHAVPTAAVQSVLLALEESLVNIMTHGYCDEQEHPITVALTVMEGEMCLELTDDGIPFDPHTLPPPDLSLPVDERPIGGLGVWLMKQMMDEVQYRRVGPQNTLRLVKRWAQP